MPLSKLSLRELETLEAEVMLALADQTLPQNKPDELEKRLEAIRVKMGLDKPQ
jgi:hypothetical protein